MAGRTIYLLISLVSSPSLELRTLAGYIIQWVTFNAILVKEIRFGKRAIFSISVV
jgi:hypothetical protein